MKEAQHYIKSPEKNVTCNLCAHRCRIKPAGRGICGVRENRDGTLYSLVYGKLVAENSDPIEKKPLFHFLPGSRSYSISTVGCNFHCQHCQNYHISQYPHMHNGAITGDTRSVEEVVNSAERFGCATISYTYVEPTIFYEFARDCSMLAHEKGIKNIFVSNGYMTQETARELATVLDGINIDIKSFSETFYKKICKAKLQPVLATLRLLHDLGVWVEVTTLLIPGLNDSNEELRGIAGFIRDVDPAIPWHVTAFYPTYKLIDPPATPLQTLRRARKIGFAAGLRFVYAGNIPGRGGENTVCPVCGEELIDRFGFSIRANRLAAGHCLNCQEVIEGVWG